MSSKGHILIVDDDTALNEMLAMHFEDLGYEVTRALTRAEALSKSSAKAPDLVLLDQHLPDGKGLEVLEALLQQDTSLSVVMITGVSDLELAMDAIGRGALDFVHKPIKTNELNHVISRALEQRRLARQVAALRRDDSERVHQPRLVGRSEAMLRVSKEIAQAAPTDATVLIVGDSGTGKELVARAIHTHSKRTGPFVAVNSAAIVDTLLESELFGHEKGAFTGAVTRKQGKFELALEGTLFFDEIGELPLSMQAKLLRVLQEQTFERVGGNQLISTNARIIAATNRNLEREVQDKRFRQDLLYRLNVLRIDLPPLWQHKDDILPIAQALLEKIGRSLHKVSLTLADDALEYLQRYDWPGNVRELENVLTQAAVRAHATVLTADLFHLPISGPGYQALSVRDGNPAQLPSLYELEAEHVQRVLDRVAGHKGHACDILGISRPALDRKIEKYGLRLSK